MQIRKMHSKNSQQLRLRTKEVSAGWTDLACRVGGLLGSMLGEADELTVVTSDGLKDEDCDCLRDTEGTTLVGELLGTNKVHS